MTLNTIVNSHNSLISQSPWPDPLSDSAMSGLAGDFVKLIEPHTEADPAAILIQFLVAFGNIIGRTPYFCVEDDRHALNLFAVLIGQTSKGRKGSSWARTRKLFEGLDGGKWVGEKIISGLSSGEGLIWAVRDETRDEPAVADKRLLVVESEYASVLKVMTREGNTLSPIIREAWNSGNLRSLTKNSPAKATAAHISIIGHITQDELRRYLNQTEVGNGFANRHLWFCVKRSKILPEGGKINPLDFAPLEERLKNAVEFSKSVDEIKRDNNARTIWIAHYPQLSEGKPGMFGSLTARAEAIVMRIACLYALLDCSAVILCNHLFAALEVWRYAEDSVRCIFGDSLGDPVADAILTALRAHYPEKMSRTEISNLLGRHVRADMIAKSLAQLAERKLVEMVREDADLGRPTEYWVAKEAK